MNHRRGNATCGWGGRRGRSRVVDQTLLGGGAVPVMVCSGVLLPNGALTLLYRRPRCPQVMEQELDVAVVEKQPLLCLETRIGFLQTSILLEELRQHWGRDLMGITVHSRDELRALTKA